MNPALGDHRPDTASLPEGSDGPAQACCRFQAGSVATVSEQTAWYAVHCKPRHEKLVAKGLEAKGLETFLPLLRRTRIYRGRRIGVELPLFSCYMFVNSEPSRLADAGWTRGVIRILGTEAGKYTPVPREQIDKVRRAFETRLKLDPHPYLKEVQVDAKVPET